MNKQLVTLVLCGMFVGAGCGGAPPGAVRPLGAPPVGAPDMGGLATPAAVVDGGAADATCGGMQFALTRVPPNVMLVLDRSGSMGGSISGGTVTATNPSKWDDLKVALGTIVQSFDSQVRFGADLFSDPTNPGSNQCNAGTVALACGATNGSKVLDQVNATSPAGNTPTAATLDEIVQHGMLNDPTRDNFVVLATDGEPNCGDTDVKSRIDTLYNSTPSVKTYVIGVGGATASDPTTLNLWAEAGHTALPAAASPTEYYQVDSPDQLKKAFTDIVGGVVSCTFKMAEHAPDPTLLNVWSNAKPVPADATNGYTYDDATPSVTLHGAACDALRNDANTQIRVEYGCPAAPIL